MSALTGTLGMGRAQAAARFTETFTFFKVTSGVIPEGQIDPVDVETTVHSGVAGQLKFFTSNVSDREQAGQLVGVQQVVVKVGVGATPNAVPNQFARVTASTVDSSLVGRVVRLTGWPEGGQTTAHRWPVEVVS